MNLRETKKQTFLKLSRNIHNSRNVSALLTYVVENDFTYYFQNSYLMVFVKTTSVFTKLSKNPLSLWFLDYFFVKTLDQTCLKNVGQEYSLVWLGFLDANLFAIILFGTRAKSSLKMAKILVHWVYLLSLKFHFDFLQFSKLFNNFFFMFCLRLQKCDSFSRDFYNGDGVLVLKIVWKFLSDHFKTSLVHVLETTNIFSSFSQVKTALRLIVFWQTSVDYFLFSFCYDRLRLRQCSQRFSLNDVNLTFRILDFLKLPVFLNKTFFKMINFCFEINNFIVWYI